MNGTSKVIKFMMFKLQKIILIKVYLLLISFFLISITCTHKCNHDNKDDVYNFIKTAQTKPIKIFEGWSIMKRSRGFIFNYNDTVHILMFIIHENKELMFKELSPQQDSVFYSLDVLENRTDRYPFKDNNFSDKLFLFIELNIDDVNWIVEDSLSMFVNEDFVVIYSQKEKDIRELSRFKEYSKYNTHWYYYKKILDTK